MRNGDKYNCFYAVEDGVADGNVVIDKKFPAKRRVSFNSKDEIRILESDLKFDDEEFKSIAKKVFKMIESQINGGARPHVKESSQWIPGFFSSKDQSPPKNETKLHPTEMKRFQDAFEYRLNELPECRRTQASDAETLVRQLARTVKMSGWPGEEREKSYAECVRRDAVEGSSCDNYCELESQFYPSKAAIDRKRPVEALSELVQNHISSNMTIETITSEINHLTEIANATKDREVREYCDRQSSILESLMEERGYIRGRVD